jgi:hypothetical protein
MPPMDIVVFAVMLFLALAALLEWRHRRAVVQQRMDRGLREFVANTPPAPQDGEDLQSADESVMAVQ